MPSDFVNGILFGGGGEGLCRYIIKGLSTRTSGFRVGHKPSDSVLKREGQEIGYTDRGAEAEIGWKGEGRNLSQSLHRERGPTRTLISDFWPPELCEDQFLFFLAA